MMTEEGWAVVSGRILVNTVSETRRAAIVNYLVAHHNINITNAWTDGDIERCWNHWGAHSNVKQVKIYWEPHSAVGTGKES